VADDKDAVQREIIFYSAFHINPDGKKALEMLADTFDKDQLLGDTPETTYYNLGRRAVVRYIQSMLRAAGKHE
jgi:hypothetical protein